MTQPSLFADPASDGLTVGEALKSAGMAQAADNKASLLKFARKLATEIASKRTDRTCTADDVQAALVANGISERALGNAAGSLFTSGGWRWTGRWVKSRRAHAHANDIRVWEYVGEKSEGA